MILHTYGSVGWSVKMNDLLKKTADFCAALEMLGLAYFRHPQMNMVAINSNFISDQLAKKFYLVPDSEKNPQWYKLVIMPQTKAEILQQFLSDLSAELLLKRLEP